MDIDELQQIAETALDVPAITHFKKIVKGRKAHIDADGLCYRVCDLEHSLSENYQRLVEYIHTWRKLAGAEFAVAHLTMGYKGREDIARVKEYQANRDKSDLPKHERVADLKGLLGNMEDHPVIQVRANYDQEADDSLCQAMHEDEGDRVLISADKDLWMVPGAHLDLQSLQIVQYPNAYGSTHMYTTVEGKRKVKGKGTSWFWHQMLMGDAVDNVPGLPYLTANLWTKHAPTKEMVEYQRRLVSGRMPSGRSMTQKQRQAANEKYKNLMLEAKHKQIGAALAVKYLKNCLNDCMAYNMVCDAYRDWYREAYEFIDWEGKQVLCHWTDMMHEQARLLWLKRYPYEDVVDWFDELERGKSL